MKTAIRIEGITLLSIRGKLLAMDYSHMPYSKVGKARFWVKEVSVNSAPEEITKLKEMGLKFSFCALSTSGIPIRSLKDRDVKEVIGEEVIEKLFKLQGQR